MSDQFFNSLSKSIPYTARVKMAASYAFRLGYETRLAKRRVMRGVPAAPRPFDCLLANARHFEREVDAGIQYQTGPRRGQQLADVGGMGGL